MYDDIPTLVAEIQAGEDTYLELKEVVFQGNNIRFAREKGKAQQKIAEVFASMANTEGGVVVFGVNDDHEIVGVNLDKKPILEQWVINLCRDLTKPPLAPLLDWVNLPDADGILHICLKVTIPKDIYSVIWTWDGRPLKPALAQRYTVGPKHHASGRPDRRRFPRYVGD